MYSPDAVPVWYVPIGKDLPTQLTWAISSLQSLTSNQFPSYSGIGGRCPDTQSEVCIPSWYVRHASRIGLRYLVNVQWQNTAEY